MDLRDLLNQGKKKLEDVFASLPSNLGQAITNAPQNFGNFIGQSIQQTPQYKGAQTIGNLVQQTPDFLKGLQTPSGEYGQFLAKNYPSEYGVGAPMGQPFNPTPSYQAGQKIQSFITPFIKWQMNGYNAPFEQGQQALAPYAKKFVAPLQNKGQQLFTNFADYISKAPKVEPTFQTAQTNPLQGLMGESFAQTQYRRKLNMTPQEAYSAENVVKNAGSSLSDSIKSVLQRLKNAKNVAQVDSNQLNLQMKNLAQKAGLSPQLEQKLVFYSELQGNMASNYAKANGLTNDILIKATPIIERHRLINEQIRQQALNSGLDMGYIQNHILHKFKQSAEEVQAVVNEMGKGLGKTPGFTQKRTTPPYALMEDYIKQGKLTPRYSTFGQADAAALEQLHTALANKQTAEELLKYGSGETSAPKGWVVIASDLFPKAPTGERYAFPPEIAKIINNEFGGMPQSVVQKGIEKAADVSASLQDVVLSGGIKTGNFYTLGKTIKDITTGLGDILTLHPIRGTKTALTPFKALIRDWIPGMSENFEKANYKYIRELADSPMGYRGAFKYQDLQKNTFEKLDMEKVAKTGKNIWQAYANNPTFQRFDYQRTVDLYKNFRNHLVNSGVSEESAVKQAIKMVEKYEGVKSVIGRDPDINNLLKAVFLAPKYREAMLTTGVNIAKGFTTQLKNPAFEQSRRLGIGMLVTYFGIYDQLNQKLNNGKHMWENPAGKEMELVIPYTTTEGATRYYSIPWMPGSTAIYRRIAGIIAGVLKGDNAEAFKQFSTLFSVPVSKGMELATGKDYFGRDIVKQDTENYGSIPSQYATWGVKSFAPGPIREGLQYKQDQSAYEKKTALGKKANPPNLGITIARAMELPIKEGAFPNPFFQVRDQVFAKNDPETVAAYNRLHPSTAEFEVKEPRTVTEQIQQATERAYNPQLVIMEREIAVGSAQQQGKPVDPLYTYPLETVLKYYNYQRQNPGSQDKKDILASNPEVLSLIQARSAYFEANPLPDQPKTDRPLPSAYVQQQMDMKNWKDPQVQAYLNANTAYQNQQRQLLGLTPLAGYVPYKKKASISIKAKKTPTIKIKNPSLASLKLSKMPSFKSSSSKTIAFKIKQPKKIFVRFGKKPLMPKV